MKKLCFGTFATILVRCSAPTTTQKRLVGTMLLSVNKKYDIRTDDGTTSALAIGHVNLSDDVTVYAKDTDSTAVTEYFKSDVLPLLDLNRRGTVILALKDIIAADEDISDDRELELVNRQTKADIITRDTFVFEDFLAGLFLYTVIYTSNNKRESNVKEVTDSYVKNFDSRKNEITFVPTYSIGNMEILNEAALDAKTINLITEEGGLCPCCARPLQSAQTILIEIGTGVDMLFCTSCAADIQNSPQKKAAYLEVKKKYKSRTDAMEAISSDKISNAVCEIIEMIGSGEPITESELRMIPLKVENKVADRNLLRKIKSYVVDGMYEMVNNIINQLAEANKLNVRQFERSIKRMYEDAEDNFESQSEIFNSLVKYLFAKSEQKNYEACEVLISYFVQRCEVFCEITK